MAGPRPTPAWLQHILLQQEIDAALRGQRPNLMGAYHPGGVVWGPNGVANSDASFLAPRDATAVAPPPRRVAPAHIPLPLTAAPSSTLVDTTPRAPAIQSHTDVRQALGFNPSRHADLTVGDRLSHLMEAGLAASQFLVPGEENELRLVAEGGARVPFRPLSKLADAEMSIPPSVRRGSDTIGKLLERAGIPSDASSAEAARINAELASLQQAAVGRPTAASPYFQMDEVTPERFHSAVQDFVQNRPSEAGFLTQRTPEQMASEGMRTFLSPDGKTGYALADLGDGRVDIRNLFNQGGKGNGEQALRHAINQGGNVLDHFDTKLGDLYRRNGFLEYTPPGETASRLPFNDAYAPPGWDYEKYGRPDVVFQRLPSAPEFPSPRADVMPEEPVGPPEPTRPEGPPSGFRSNAAFLQQIGAPQADIDRNLRWAQEAEDELKARGLTEETAAAQTPPSATVLRVHRVGDMTEGPYNFNQADLPLTSSPRSPAPVHDGLDYVPDNALFGFKDPNALMKWFTPAERQRLLDAGYETRAYSIPKPNDNILHGGHQLVFNPDVATRTQLPGLFGAPSSKPFKSLSDILPYLTQEEQQHVLGSKVLQRELVERAGQLGPDEPLIAASLMGQHARGGYANVGPTLESTFGIKDAPQFDAIWAAVSPRQLNENAIEMAQRVMNRYRQGGPISPEDLKSLVQMPSRVKNTARALVNPLNPELSGLKVESFLPNLRSGSVLAQPGDAERVTNDALMAQGMGVNPARFGNYASYYAANAQQRRVAESLSRLTGVRWLPMESQETAWSTIRGLGNLPGAESAMEAGTFPNLVDRMTPDIARQQWNPQMLSDLFNQEPHASLLAEGGYTPPPMSTAEPELQFPTGDMGDLRKLAQTMQNHYHGQYLLPGLLAALGLGGGGYALSQGGGEQ